MASDPRPDPRSDEALISDYQRAPGSPAGRGAAGILLDRWSGRVYLWTRRSVRDHDRALDLAQDCLMQAFRGLARYESSGRFPAWLFTIVHHRCASVARRRSLIVDPEIDPDALVADGAGPAEAFESDEARRRIFAAMDTALEPQERAALWLRAYEGMSVEEITRVLALDGATGARGLLQTARRKLRRALNGDQEGDA